MGAIIRTPAGVQYVPPLPTGPAGATGAPGLDGAPGPAGPAPAGTGLVSVTNGALDTPSPLAARLTADRSATYAFDDATGVTLEDGSVGGSAAVAGGLLVLTCPATPAAPYAVGDTAGPRGVVQIPAINGRRPARWRVRVRFASMDVGVVAHILACTSGAVRHGFYVYSPGTWGFTNNSGGGDYVTGSGFAIDGTGWAELEYDGTEYLYARRGTGVGTAEPTTWTEIGRATMGTNLLTEVRLVAATYADDVERVVEMDDLIFEALP